MSGRPFGFKKPEGLYFHSALGGSPRALAHMLDSLVRVSRRDVERHFVRVSRAHGGCSGPNLVRILSRAHKKA